MPSQTVRADELRDEPVGPDGERPGQAALEAAAQSGGVAGVTGQAALAGEDPDEAAREYARQEREAPDEADAAERRVQAAQESGMRTATVSTARRRTTTDPATVAAVPPPERDAG